MPLAAVLAVQRTREEAEKACREALATGDNGAWIALGNVLVAQPGREEEAEDAYRKAIAAGHNSGWLGVGNVLLQRRGCERGAEAAYREAIKADVDAQTRAGARHGEVLARRTRFTRRSKYALVALVVIAFVVNLIFKDDSSEAWTVLGNLDGLVFWLALCVFRLLCLSSEPRWGLCCAIDGSGEEPVAGPHGPPRAVLRSPVGAAWAAPRPRYGGLASGGAHSGRGGGWRSGHR